MASHIGSYSIRIGSGIMGAISGGAWDDRSETAADVLRRLRRANPLAASIQVCDADGYPVARYPDLREPTTTATRQGVQG